MVSAVRSIGNVGAREDGAFHNGSRVEMCGSAGALVYVVVSGAPCQDHFAGSYSSESTGRAEDEDGICLGACVQSENT